MKKCLVYTLKLANQLVELGYEIIETSINTNNPKYKVFFFEDTPEIRAEIKRLTAK